MTYETSIGANMYAYCLNNPVNQADSAGCWSGKEFIKEITKNYIKPFVESHEKRNTLSANETHSVGVSFGGAFGGSASVALGITYDNRGNVGLMGTIAGGGGSPSFSANVFKTETNAKNIYSQGGWGLQVGGSVAVSGGSLGIEYLLFPNYDTGGAYHGVSYFAGVGAPVLIEMHGEASYSVVKGKNIYREFDKIYSKLMNW